MFILRDINGRKKNTTAINLTALPHMNTKYLKVV